MNPNTYWCSSISLFSLFPCLSLVLPLSPCLSPAGQVNTLNFFDRLQEFTCSNPSSFLSSFAMQRCNTNKFQIRASCIELKNATDSGCPLDDVVARDAYVQVQQVATTSGPHTALPAGTVNVASNAFLKLTCVAGTGPVEGVGDGAPISVAQGVRYVQCHRSARGWLIDGAITKPAARMQCAPCPAGRFSDASTGYICAPCASGYFSGVGASSCQLCTHCASCETCESDGTCKQNGQATCRIRDPDTGVKQCVQSVWTSSSSQSADSVSTSTPPHQSNWEALWAFNRSGTLGCTYCDSAVDTDAWQTLPDGAPAPLQSRCQTQTHVCQNGTAVQIAQPQSACKDCQYCYGDEYGCDVVPNKNHCMISSGSYVNGVWTSTSACGCSIGWQWSHITHSFSYNQVRAGLGPMPLCLALAIAIAVAHFRICRLLCVPCSCSLTAMHWTR